MLTDPHAAKSTIEAFITWRAQVRLRIERLLGSFNVLNVNATDGTARPSSLYATADICSSGKPLCLSSRTPFAESAGEDAFWGTCLQFPLKVRLLPLARALAVRSEMFFRFQYYSL